MQRRKMLHTVHGKVSQYGQWKAQCVGFQKKGGTCVLCSTPYTGYIAKDNKSTLQKTAASYVHWITVPHVRHGSNLSVLPERIRQRKCTLKTLKCYSDIRKMKFDHLNQAD